VINTTRKTLVIISAIVWIIGGIILFLKGYSLLKEAQSINSNMEIISAVMVTAFIIGLIKNKYIFTKFNKKNLIRINKLEKPKIYQFFELRFLIFLSLMILMGIMLSKLASGNYTVLLAVGALDLALATALLKSSIVFLRK